MHVREEGGKDRDSQKWSDSRKSRLRRVEDANIEKGRKNRESCKQGEKEIEQDG